MARRILPTGMTHLALIIISIALVAPFFYVISASLKDSGALFSYPPTWVEIPVYWGNYAKLLFHTQFWRWMLNTLFVAGSVTFLKVFLDSMAGYALAKFNFVGKRVVFILLLVLMMVPTAAVIIPLWVTVYRLGLINTYWALILPPLSNPLGPFLMRQFILALPADLVNAARLEGLSEFGIYRRIVLPLVKPGLVVLAILLFSSQVMSYIWPLVATSSDSLNMLTVGVAGLRAKGGTNYGLWSAAGVMAMVPMTIFFLALQKQFMTSNMAGALK
jgi:ABC-type glycerol-3-phosphate transport system permease component